MSLLVFSLLLLLVSPQGTTLAADHQPPVKPILTPILKDPSTSLYTIPIKDGGAPLVLELAGPLLWSTCAPAHRTIPCISSNPLFPVSFSAFGSCAPDALLASLPSGAAGVAGPSRLPLSLPSQVASLLKVPKRFAMCLPTSGARSGAAIFGGSPFQLLAAPPVDVAEGFFEDPHPFRFLKNPRNGAYYVRVTGIEVNNERVPLPPGTFDLHALSGTGGVMLSTVTPYTTLRSDIYRPLRRAFDAATSGIPRAAAGGLAGNASLVQVNDRTVCFAFLEVGPATVVPGSPAVIFGGFQMEDHLLMFDLEKEAFGFRGPLPGIRTHCGNFDFSMGSS
ncbi:hypothetical protein C2845_PM07G34180 [Panicum miliaceum]|uniref:Peptidase A1 domain-containing protein n=1 Tax=Panicum miliaceum TaxID=4540 RepID=A0A3L6SS64_PANMI|nr:hypothetical protein C2845_PM07G34180 [Panicum miliaceum]